MVAASRLLCLTSAAAVVLAASAAIGGALSAGSTCPCALLDSGTSGQCLTLTPTVVGGAVGTCVAKTCKSSFGCVAEAAATHACLARAVKEPVCIIGGAVGVGAPCACELRDTGRTTLTPTAIVASRSACTAQTLSLAAVLAAPGRQVTLQDGRVVTASVHSVGGCQPVADASVRTGTGAGNLTRLAQGPSGSSCTLYRPYGWQLQFFTKFQAIVVSVSGGVGTMRPSLTLEDVDVQTVSVLDVAKGWRESMTVVGRTESKVVLPTLAPAPNSWVGVYDYGMSGTALKSVGWADAVTIAIKGVAYKRRDYMINVKGAQAYLARATVEFTQPITQMVVAYALNQRDSTNRLNTLAAVSAVDFQC